MPVGAIGFRSFVLVTLVADIGLFGAVHSLTGFVDYVATGTGQVFIFMYAGLPFQELSTLVAAGTHGILKFGCGSFIADIGNH